jgi:hypothetical protein
MDVYSDLMKKSGYDLNLHTFRACCLYALCRYKEAFEDAKKGLPSELNVIIYNIFIKIDKSKIPLCF